MFDNRATRGRHQRLYTGSVGLIVCLVGVLSGCEDRVVADTSLPDRQLLVAGEVTGNLDILFVIDSTQSMARGATCWPCSFRG